MLNRLYLLLRHIIIVPIIWIAISGLWRLPAFVHHAIVHVSVHNLQTNSLLSKTLDLYSLSPQRQGHRTPHRCRIRDLYLISSHPSWSCSSFYTPRTQSLQQLSRKQGRQWWIQWWVHQCLRQAVNWGSGVHSILVGTSTLKFAMNWESLK